MPKKPLKLDSIKRACMRILRIAVALVITGALVYVSEDPKYIALAPFVCGIAKYVREQFNIDVKIL